MVPQNCVYCPSALAMRTTGYDRMRIPKKNAANALRAQCIVLTVGDTWRARCALQFIPLDPR